jgi:hypothetical protein
MPCLIASECFWISGFGLFPLSYGPFFSSHAMSAERACKVRPPMGRTPALRKEQEHLPLLFDRGGRPSSGTRRVFRRRYPRHTGT